MKNPSLWWNDTTGCPTNTTRERRIKGRLWSIKWFAAFIRQSSFSCMILGTNNYKSLLVLAFPKCGLPFVCRYISGKMESTKMRNKFWKCLYQGYFVVINSRILLNKVYEYIPQIISKINDDLHVVLLLSYYVDILYFLMKDSFCWKWMLSKFMVYPAAGFSYPWAVFCVVQFLVYIDPVSVPTSSVNI